MSQNNTIRKSDKKFIRLEKARIRRQFFDIVKQEEMINALYARFTKTSQPKIEKASKPKIEKPKVEIKKEVVKKPVKVKKAAK